VNNYVEVPLIGMSGDLGKALAWEKGYGKLGGAGQVQCGDGESVGGGRNECARLGRLTSSYVKDWDIAEDRESVDGDWARRQRKWRLRDSSCGD
jgi:hypothetical protein